MDESVPHTNNELMCLDLKWQVSVQKGMNQKKKEQKKNLSYSSKAHNY